jgi:murein DD-endopeptidase MepM/ murein hydrolase activator NlpD
MRKKHLNFLIIPEGSSRNIKFRLSFWKAWIILGLLGFWVLVLIVLTLLYGKAVSDLISGKSLRQENERLKRYNTKVVELEKELQEYRRFTQRVAELAGIEYPIKTETNLASLQKEARSLNEGETDLYSRNTEIASKLSERVQPEGEENATIEPESLKHMRNILRIPQGQPIEGWITRGFSLKEHAFGGEHTGIDFAAKEGTEVKVTADGKVSFVGWDDVYGNLVVVDHQNGYLTYYGHNSRILVDSVDFVKRGEVIALSGNSGRSSAPHLHYEIRKVENPAAGGDGVPIDPKNFLNPK